MSGVSFTHGDVVAAYPEMKVSTPPLGDGGFKVVYRARIDGEDAVLKIIREPITCEGEDESAGGESMAIDPRITRELECMRKSSSPHIAKIVAPLSFRRIRGQTHAWYAEEFYPKGTLDSLICQGPMPPAKVRHILRGVLLGVQALWESEEKIVHRDIKPQNIALSATGEPVLIDLGAAYYADPKATSLTGTGAIAPLTQLYAAPEQFNPFHRKNIDWRTDLFQVGMVGCEMLCGKHPFWSEGDTIVQLHDRLFAASESIFEGCPEDAGLRSFLLRAIAPAPNGRYRTLSSAFRALGVI